MNILFISNAFRLFDDADCGGGNRTTMFINALSTIGHVDVISFEGSIIKGFKGNISIIHTDRIETNYHPTNWQRRLSMVKSFYKLLRYPSSPYSFFSVNKAKENCIDAYYSLKKYDIVACRYIDTVINSGLLKYSSKLVVDIDDRPSIAIKRDIETTRFHHIWEKKYYQLRAHYIDRMTSEVLDRFICSFYSNRLEKPADNSVFLHNVSLQTNPCGLVSNNTPKRLLIVGNMNFPPNKCGIQYFVENVFAEIRKKTVDAELHIVGRIKDYRFAEKLNNVDGVVVKGYVEDIVKEYEEARVVVVPIYSGSGTSVKFIEALQLRRPIIATPLGVRGYEDVCKNGEHYLLSSDNREFIDNCLCLLDNVDLCNDIACSGYKIAHKYLSPLCFNSIVSNTVLSSINDKMR